MRTGRPHESQDATSSGFAGDGFDEHFAGRRQLESDVAKHQCLFLRKPYDSSDDDKNK